MLYQSAGEMAEWSIALPWKGSNWATGSGVRIPVSPPVLLNLFLEVTNNQSSFKVNSYIKKYIFHERILQKHRRCISDARWFRKRFKY